MSDNAECYAEFSVPLSHLLPVCNLLAQGPNITYLIIVYLLICLFIVCLLNYCFSRRF